MLYRSIRHQFAFCKYLKIQINEKHRIALTKFFTKNHKLPIVMMSRGVTRVPYDERICPTCNVLGDEFHCLFECVQTEISGINYQNITQKDLICINA